MIPGCQKMTMAELVDILAQKTQKFTQLLVDKKFDDEYRRCKEAIQQVLAEIELRKENNVAIENLRPEV
jgi:nucleoid DNA-binding protein